MPLIPRGIYRRVPWKNGGGMTEEIVAAPDLGWRLSLATIGRDGPFSIFGGFDRTIVVLDRPIALRFADGEVVRLRPLEPFRFAGERALECARLDGDAHAFNVMTARSRYHHAVRIVTDVDAIAPVDDALMYAFFLEGRYAESTARIDDAVLEGVGSDAALLVTIRPNAERADR